MISTGPLTDIHSYITGGPPMTQPKPTEQDLEKRARELHRAIQKCAYPSADGCAAIDNTALPIIALALAAEREKGMAWQPIESAPKDGTTIVVLDGKTPLLVKWTGRPRFPWQIMPGGDSCRDGDFSGWIPLPPPPARSEP